MEVRDYLPFAVVGGALLLGYALLRPQPYTVINPSPPQTGVSEGERLQALVALTQLAVQRDVARMQAEADLRAAQYEARVRELEAEAEKRRIEAEKEAAQKAAEAQFWGTFWSGLWGVVGSGLALLAGFSDEALYQRALPPYYPPSGQLGLLARRR